MIAQHELQSSLFTLIASLSPGGCSLLSTPISSLSLSGPAAAIFSLYPDFISLSSGGCYLLLSLPRFHISLCLSPPFPAAYTTGPCSIFSLSLSLSLSLLPASSPSLGLAAASSLPASPNFPFLLNYTHRSISLLQNPGKKLGDFEIPRAPFGELEIWIFRRSLRRRAAKRSGGCTPLVEGNEWIQEKSSEMKLVNAIRTGKTAALSRPHLCGSMRSIFSAKTPDASKQSSSFESADEFERRIFGGALDADSKNESFFDKLDRVGMARGRPDSKVNDGFLNRFDTLSDGMDVKLKKAAAFFGMTDEVKEDDYSYRPDVKFRPGMTYNLRDLDLTKPAAQKPFKRPEFETTTKEVLRKTDFRNVRFLANFLTEAGLIIKRSKTKISAKAQRKVAREIKTARALGLLPFTTMGTKHFQFGKSMEDFDEDFDLDGFYGPRVNNFFVDQKS